jgi:GTP-binding protein
VPTAELNRVVTDAVRGHPPAPVRNRQPKVLYATQVAVAPPTFVIFVNDPELIHFSYRRYLENRIRDEYGFLGTPIKLIFRQRVSEGAARRPPRQRRAAPRSR